MLLNKHSKISGGNIGLLTWIIHESRLLQLQGVMDAAVVLHRKSITTKQMQ
jgi:hypothetical protein